MAVRQDNDAAQVEGVEAYGDAPGDQERADLEGFSMKGDRAVLADAPSHLVVEELVEIDAVGSGADAFRESDPAVQRRLSPQTPVGFLVIVAFDPGPQKTIELPEIVEAIRVRSRKKRPPHREKPALDLRSPLRLVRTRVDELDPKASRKV